MTDRRFPPSPAHKMNITQLWIICNKSGSVFNVVGGVDALITYDKLWKTMKEKKITQYRLIKYYGFSAGQIGRLKKNMYVSTHTIETLCSILDCRVEDIFEYRPDDVPCDPAPICSDRDSFKALENSGQKLP